MTDNSEAIADVLNIDPTMSTQALKERTRQLLRELDEGNLKAATESIRGLNLDRDEMLYLEVGRLTRALHNAMKDFHLEIGLEGNAEVETKLSEMADARSRLNYVIKMTEEAANKTMDMVEEGAPVAQQLAAEARAVLEAWQSRQGPPDAALEARLGAVLERTVEDTARLNARFNDILMAQGYQDLSGQVIKRVIELVSDVEHSLVRLVTLASNVERVAGLNTPLEEIAEVTTESRIKAEGPSFGAGRSEVVSGQDDVDTLLSSLGF